MVGQELLAGVACPQCRVSGLFLMMGRLSLMLTGIFCSCAQMRRALVLSMALHRSVIRQGISMLDKQSIRTLRTFRLAIVREGPDVAVFAHPATLGRLAVWLVDAIRDLVPKDDKLKRRKGLPFVAACLDERRDAYLVVGVNGATEYGDVRKK